MHIKMTKEAACDILKPLHKETRSRFQGRPDKLATALIALDAHEGVLTARGYGKEIALTLRRRVEITEAGRTAVAIEPLMAILTEAKPQDMIELIGRGKFFGVRIEGAAVEYRIHAEDASHYADLHLTGGALSEGAPNFKIKAKTLTRAFESVRSHMSDDKSRPQLCGIYMHCKGKRLNFVATQGHTLGRFRIPEGPGMSDFPRCNVPARAVKAFLDWNISPDDDVTLTHLGLESSWNRRVLFDVPPGDQEEIIAARLGSHSFPDYERVIPKTFVNRLRIDKNLMLEALEAAALACAEGKKTSRKQRIDACDVIMRFEKGRDVMLFQPRLRKESANGNRHTSHEAIKTRCFYDGRDFRIGMRAPYLMHSIKSMNSEQIEIQMPGISTAPICIKESGGGNDNLSVVMPISINQVPVEA